MRKNIFEKHLTFECVYDTMNRLMPEKSRELYSQVCGSGLPTIKCRNDVVMYTKPPRYLRIGGENRELWTVPYKNTEKE